MMAGMPSHPSATGAGRYLFWADVGDEEGNNDGERCQGMKGDSDAGATRAGRYLFLGTSEMKRVGK